MKFGIKSVAAALLATLVLAGCGQKEENKTLKVGAIAGPETELVEVAAKVAKEKYGLTVEVVNFSDYVTPNVDCCGAPLAGRPWLGACVIEQHGLRPVFALGRSFLRNKIRQVRSGLCLFR